MTTRRKIDVVIVTFLWLLLMLIYRGIRLEWTDGTLISFVLTGMMETLIISLQAGTSIIAWTLLNRLFKKTP